MDEELQLFLQKSFVEVQYLLIITKQETTKTNPTLSKPGTGGLYHKSTVNIIHNGETVDALSQR